MTRPESGRPVVASADLSEVEALHRLDLGDHHLGEDWLQQLIAAHPDVLPVDDFDPTFGPLVVIGREVESGAGPIDVLCVSPNGTLTIVETKLWRNPEARRQVVAQILDYAAALAQWSYDRLDETARAGTRRSLWDLVGSTEAVEAPTTEREFTDAVARSLRVGRFLLLIVGDGIREEVERMVEYVQSHPQLQFTLGLVELRVYERSRVGERLVVPSIVARTAEVTRAIVEVNVAPEASVEVTVAVPVDDDAGTRRKLDEDTFFAALETELDPAEVDFVRSVLDEFRDDPRFAVEWGTKSMVIKRRRLLAGAPNLTLLGIWTGGGFFIGWLSGQLPKNGVSGESAVRFAADTAAIVGTTIHPRWADTWKDDAPVGRVQEVWPALREAIITFVDSLDGESQA